MPKWVRSLPRELFLRVRATSLSDFKRIYLNWQLADNYSADGNGNVKKAVSLISNTTVLHVHHAFFYISYPSLHNYNVKWPNFELTWERERQGNKLYYLSCWTRTRSPLFSSKLTSLLSSNWMTLYKSKKVSKDATFSLASLLSNGKVPSVYQATGKKSRLKSDFAIYELSWSWILEKNIQV